MPITTGVVSSNHAFGEVYSIQHYVIKFVSDLRQVGGFLRGLRFPPPIKLTATIHLRNIVESDVKHPNPNQTKPKYDNVYFKGFDLCMLLQFICDVNHLCNQPCKRHILIIHKMSKIILINTVSHKNIIYMSNLKTNKIFKNKYYDILYHLLELKRH